LGAIGQNAPGYGQRKDSGVAQAGSAIADAGRRQAEHSAVLQRCAVVNGAPGGRMRNTQAHWGLFFTAGQRIEFARRFSATTQSAMRAIALSLALAVLPLSANAARAQEAGIPVGSTGPNVTLETLDGGTVELSQWVGKKPVLLEFWASWCPNCKALEPAMEAAHAEFGDRVEFIGIAV